MTGLLIQEFKTLIKSPASISILIIPLVLLVGLGYLLPAGWIVPSSITIGIVAAVLLYFGGSIEEIKRTSFMKSVSLTRLSKFSFLATKILFAMMVSVVTVLWVLLFSWIFTETPVAFLATDFGNLLGTATDGNTGLTVLANIPFKVQWDRVQWIKMLYAGIVTILVAVSLSFVFVAFSKSSLSFYLMSFGYLLAMILFGGVVMPGFLISPENQWFKSLYYLVPNFYTNNLMANSFSGGVVPSLVASINNDVINPLIAQVSEGFSTSLLADFLTLQIDPTIVANASQVEINTVVDFINGWDGKEKTLNAAYDALVVAGTTSDYYDAAYAYLSTPFSAGYSNWGEYFVKDALDTIIVPLGNLINIPNLEGIIEKAPWFTIQGVLNKVGLDINSFTNNIMIGGVQAIRPTADAIAGNLDGTIHAIFSTIFDGLMGAIETNAPDLYAGLMGMFADIEWWNWPVPWIEGALFLGISIKFFKWS